MTTEQVIYNQAIKGTNNNPGLPVSLANLLVSQAKHETGNFTSNFFKNYNNAFGYSYNQNSSYQIAPGTIADNGIKIAAYRNIADSTKEVIDWIYRRVNDGSFPKNLNTIVSPEQYVLLLKKAGYFTDTITNYLTGLKKYFTQVLQIFEKPTALVFLGIVSIAVYFLIKKK